MEIAKVTCGTSFKLTFSVQEKQRQKDREYDFKQWAILSGDSLTVGFTSTDLSSIILELERTAREATNRLVKADLLERRKSSFPLWYHLSY